MGSQGLIVYDAVEVMLSRETEVLSDSVGESCCGEELLPCNSSCVTGGISTSQGTEGVLSFSGMTLALERGLRADRC